MTKLRLATFVMLGLAIVRFVLAILGHTALILPATAGLLAGISFGVTWRQNDPVRRN